MNESGIFACIKAGNAATATVLQYLMPVFIVGYTALKKRKLPRYLELICVGMVVGGTFLLVTHGSLDKLSISPLALFWGLASAVAAAFYTMQPNRLFPAVPECQLRHHGLIGHGVDPGHGVPAGQA